MMRKTAAAILAFLIIAVIAVCPAAVPFHAVAEAQSSVSSVSMPIEYVNYTVSTINGTLWATVDGTYLMQIPQASVGQKLLMFYPTPPGITNISLKLNGQPVSFSNLTQSDPSTVHYTYLGNWSMIFFIIQPVSPSFLLTIHYQHPIVWANGTYMFLYDLNISPYLSNSSTASTARFTVLFKTNCTGIKVYTVPGDESILRNEVRTPVNFTLSEDNGTQAASFNITSDYGKPVPGDELVTFNEAHTQVPEFQSALFALAAFIAATSTTTLFCLIKNFRRKSQ